MIIGYYDKTGDQQSRARWQQLLQTAFARPNLARPNLARPDLARLNLAGPDFVALDSAAGRHADIALVWGPPAGLLASCKRLRLIISLGQGVDHIMRDPDLPDTVPVCRLVDPDMAHALSQWVIAVLLDHLRDGPAYREQAAGRVFQQRPQIQTLDLPVAVYGLGAIGRVIAERLAAIGFQVLGWAASQKSLPDIACHSGPAGWQHCLQTARAHICILPLTKKTENLFNAKAFAQMPKASYFINGGRGRQLVEEDLLAAIQSGQLAGAALDVFRTEPLPEEHAFWLEPRITIWPHVAARTNPETASRQVIAAIEAVLDGQLPANLLDRTRGY